MSSRSRPAGFSLLESLLAGFLLIFVLSGVVVAATLYERSMLKSGNRLAARNFAQRLLEESIAIGFENVASRTETQALTWRTGRKGSALSEGQQVFEAQVTVTDDPPLVAGGEVEVKNVLVVVTYPEHQSVGRLQMGTKVFFTE